MVEESLKRMLIWCVLICGIPSPASELAAAAADCAAVAPIDRPFTRYLTTYAIDADARTRTAALSFWINSLSTARRAVRPVNVSPTLLRVDLRNYHWPAAAWESIAAVDPYLRHLQRSSVHNQLAAMTGSAAPVLRADHFLRRSALQEHYREFLGLTKAKTVADVQAAFRVRADDARALRLEIAGSTLSSRVALYNRRLIRTPTLAGYWWASDDHDTSSGRDSVLDFLTDSDADAHEFIWSLPNGLQAYAIANAAGVLLEVVPANIAQDFMTARQDKQIANPASCVGCHSSGINPFTDVVAGMIRGGVLSLKSADPAKTQAIDDLFLADLVGTIDADRELYRKAVDLAAGVDPETAAQAFDVVLDGYLDRKVDQAAAARELGIEPDDLPRAAVKYGDGRAPNGTLAAILAGQAVARDAWAQAFEAAALVLQVEDAMKGEER